MRRSRPPRNRRPSKTTSLLSTWAAPVTSPAVLPFFALAFFVLPAFLLCDFTFSEFASESEADDWAAFTFFGIVVVVSCRKVRSQNRVYPRARSHSCIDCAKHGILR